MNLIKMYKGYINLIIKMNNNKYFYKYKNIYREFSSCHIDLFT